MDIESNLQPECHGFESQVRQELLVAGGRWQELLCVCTWMGHCKNLSRKNKALFLTNKGYEMQNECTSEHNDHNNKA